MPKSLLTLVQNAADELGIPRPSAVVGSSDQTVRQLLALMQREGEELSAREGPSQGWPHLVREHTFSTVNGTADYALPTAFRYYINGTQWDRTNKWPLNGPTSPQKWQELKSGIVTSAKPYRFRIKANSLGVRRVFFDPTPTTVDACVIEFISTFWCANAAGTVPQSIWTLDTDIALLPEELFTLGLKWRFRRAKGLDASVEYQTYEDAVSRELGRAAMAPDLPLGRRPLSSDDDSFFAVNIEGFGGGGFGA